MNIYIFIHSYDNPYMLGVKSLVSAYNNESNKVVGYYAKLDYSSHVVSRPGNPNITLITLI